MNRGFFVNAGFGQSFLEGNLDAGCGQGLIRCCLPVSAPSGSREEPVFMAVGFPKLPEELQGTPGQRHIPVFVAFTVNVEKHAVAVDIGNLQGPAFGQSQAAGIDCGQADAMAEHVDACEGASDLIDAQDGRQGLDTLGLDKTDGGPILPQGILVEELDSTEGDGASHP